MVLATLASAWTFALIDAWRRGFREWGLSTRLLSALLLYAVVGAGVGVFAALLGALERALTERWLRRAPPRARSAVALAFYALVVGALVSPTALATFQGPRARAYARVGPVVFVMLAALAAALVAGLAARAQGALRRGRPRWPLLGALAAGLAAAGLVYGDLHLFVALYRPLHTLLELTAGALLALGAAVPLALLLARPRARRVGSVLTLLVLGWLVAWFALAPLRERVVARLSDAWLDPIYVGRMMRRLDVAQTVVAHPVAWRERVDSPLHQLEERFRLTNTSPDPAWYEPVDDPPATREALARLRGPRRDYNVLFYYVDTLRADVARDRRTMPATVAFAKKALDFSAAYSSGSDTLRALPGLIGGTYSIDAPRSHDLIQVARRTGRRTVLAIPRSAKEFLDKLRADFHFDTTLVVPDYSDERTDVWGYGADRSTARPLVDEALGWLKKHPRERFFLWVFNFDQHNWRELEPRYLKSLGRRFQVPDGGEQERQYRLVARGIDAEFQRLLTGLARLGLAENTIVVFVSDHGEALGRDGFWVHSVFLWESLVRVPLAIRVPGMRPARIGRRVSLVDVAPTLVHYLEEEPDASEYEGEDLLRALLPSPPPRRRPLLFSAVLQEQLVRVGMLDPVEPWKLVVSLETATPELYDLRAHDPDARSVADANPERTLPMLEALIRSPVFPRAAP